MSKTDSSSQIKTDSVYLSTNTTTEEKTATKEYESEITIEFDSLSADKVYNPDSSMEILVQGGQLIIRNYPVKSFTKKTRGKDSSTTVQNIATKDSGSLKKEVKSDVKKVDKKKTVDKQTKRSSLFMWLVFGAVLVAALFLYLLFKRIK